MFPVDPDALHIPEYRDIIENPMDLTTIKLKLEGGNYGNIDEFIEDVNLVWDNAMKFNHEGSEIYEHAMTLKNLFQKITMRLKELSVPRKDLERVKVSKELETVRQEHEKVLEREKEILEQKKKLEDKEGSLPPVPKVTKTKKLSYDEKKEIYDRYKTLECQYKYGLNLVLAKSKTLKGAADKVSIEIDTIETPYLHKLLLYLRSCENFKVSNGENHDEKKKETLLVFEPVGVENKTEVVAAEESSSSSSSEMSVDTSSSDESSE
jgi:hypothetical protein